ncbi:DISARM system helicase DrmA [Sorangium sp. So ce1036]
MPDVTAPRDHLVRALHADLVGPYQLDEGAIAEQEILELPPSRHYLTGFLASEEERSPEDDTADDGLGAGPDEPEEENQGGGEEPEDKRPNLWPASIGMSVLVPRETRAVKATVRFAEYSPDTVKPEGRGRGHRVWKRKPRQTIVTEVPLDARILQSGIRLQDTVGIMLYGQVKAVERARGIPEGTQALALFVVNRRGQGDKGRRDEQMIFQVELEIECAEGIVPRPNFSDEDSDQWDQKVADLQFRERVEYAVGHGVAVEVPPGQGGVGDGGSPGEPGSAPRPPVTRVKTTWLPEYEVRRVVAHEEEGVTVAMDELAKLERGEDVRARLERLPAAYGAWIQKQRSTQVEGDKRAETRDELMRKAEEARRRIEAGIELLASDAQIRQAFCMANEAMAEAARHRSPSRYQGGKRPEWRLFQLAFLLMNLNGVADGEHADRERVELIFFPTGGGKTEAYLGVIAFCLLLRRLRRAKLPDGGLGVAVLLRYTLRLLTLDQLGRAATLLCALESQRRKRPAVLGDTRFSVGLWVGRSATANTMEEASRLVTGFKLGVNGNPCPLPACPWCGKELGPNSLSLLPSKTAPDEVRVGCTSETCEFSCANNSEGIPVVFVDDQVYRELPSFLIATVDKLAMMPWRGEAGMLFGKASARGGRRFYGPMDGKPPRAAKSLPGGLAPPELIVQDELHLISGPLGTMVGLYETAVDALCSRPASADPRSTAAPSVVRPKVLAATATVRRADTQIQALFGRPAAAVSVFPPPGIDDSETYFATVDGKSPGRKYVGVAAQGRSMKAILLRVYRTLLAGAMKAYDPSLPPDQTADAYMTLAGYFNSLRELGGMRRLVDDEVLARTKQAEDARPLNATGKHLWFENRELGDEPVELTSREHTDKVKRTKDRLNKPWRDPEAINVLLASNMISVGVDIDRLGLMVVAGQPKTTAEYIQASSRVGRQERWPGLVVTVYNLHKSRDRSHYEHFAAYHESFYRFVEATSVTPFSGPALDRGLVGTLTSMIRFASHDLTPPRGAMALPANRHLADAVVERIAARASCQPELQKDGQEKLAEELRLRGHNLLDTWTDLVRSTPEEPKQRRYSKFDREKVGGKPLLYTPLDEERPGPDTADGRFAAPTSLRDVESTAHLWLVGRRLGRQD